MVEDLIIAGKIWSISNKFFMLRNHLFPKVLALTSILVLSACGEIPPWPSTPTPSMVRELQQITTSTIAPVTTLAPGSRQEIVTGPIAIEPKNVKQVGKWAKLAKEQSYPPQWVPDGRWMAIPAMASGNHSTMPSRWKNGIALQQRDTSSLSRQMIAS